MNIRQTSGINPVIPGLGRPGHSFKLKKKRFNTQLRQHFFTERVINLWNSLDDSIVSATTINSFKNELHRLWTRDEFPMGLL